MKAFENYIGRSPDVLSLRERIDLVGKWIALELYTPKTLPLRLIAAVGDTPAEVYSMLRSRGLEPARFELLLFRKPA
ncbi:MAG TPA: hypothetical protein VES20_24955 [Bryobacteraceae bacterium]|nr:hypothetical protein [Bryobacteraceae bacterium]